MDDREQVIDRWWIFIEVEIGDGSIYKSYIILFA